MRSNGVEPSQTIIFTIENDEGWFKIVQIHQKDVTTGEECNNMGLFAFHYILPKLNAVFFFCTENAETEGDFREKTENFTKTEDFPQNWEIHNFQFQKHWN